MYLIVYLQYKMNSCSNKMRKLNANELGLDAGQKIEEQMFKFSTNAK